MLILLIWWLQAKFGLEEPDLEDRYPREKWKKSTERAENWTGTRCQIGNGNFLTYLIVWQEVRMVVVMIVIILKYFYHPYMVLQNPNPKLQSRLIEMEAMILCQSVSQTTGWISKKPDGFLGLVMFLLLAFPWILHHIV